MGGDSSQRQASLASGLNAWAALRHQADYQVCPEAASTDLTGLPSTWFCAGMARLLWCGIARASPRCSEGRRRWPQMRK